MFTTMPTNQLPDMLQSKDALECCVWHSCLRLAASLHGDAGVVSSPGQCWYAAAANVKLVWQCRP